MPISGFLFVILDCLLLFDVEFSRTAMALCRVRGWFVVDQCLS